MKHRTGLVLVLPAMAAGLALLPATASFADTGSFTASAVGANEPDGGADDASAEGRFRVDSAAGQFCYTVTAEGLDDAAAMHIHEGPKGKNGPVVIPLDQKRIGAGETCTSAKAAVLEGILAQPANYYLNIHTPAFAAGAVRDQLSPTSPSSANAGSGGLVDDGLPVAPILLIGLGLAVVGTAGRRLAQR